MFSSPVRYWTRSTSTVDSTRDSSISGTDMTGYVCDFPDEWMGQIEVPAQPQPIDSSTSALPSSLSPQSTQSPTVNTAAIRSSNAVVIAYHLPFPMPPPTSPRVTQQPKWRVRIASGWPNSLHFIRKEPDNQPLGPRKLSKSYSRRSRNVDQVDQYPLKASPPTLKNPPTMQHHLLPSSSSTLMKPTRKLSLVMKRGLGTLRRYSRMVHTKDQVDCGVDSPQLEEVGDDPFGRMKSQSVSPMKNSFTGVRSPQRRQHWKTHARRTLSKSGKESISLPMECLSPIGSFTPISQSSLVKPIPEGTYVPLRSPKMDDIATVWRTSLSLFISRPPPRPASKPVLFSSSEQTEIGGWGEHSSKELVQLQRLATLARLEGKSSAVLSIEEDMEEMDRNCDWSALEYVWSK